MTPHATCGTCIHNDGARCTNEASRYHGSPVKSWTCAAGLDYLAAKGVGEYKPYFADRARQCRSWAADLKEGHRSGDADIIGGLKEFERLAL
jgi:hypothetical protein